MSQLRKTAFFSIIYAIGVVLNRAVSFIMLPIYTRCLTPKDYGTLELLTMTTDLFGMMVSFGLGSAMYKYYYKYESEKDRNMVVSTVTILIILFYFMASSIGYFASEPLAGLILEGGKQNKVYFQLIFAIFFLQSFIEIPLTFIKAQQRPYIFVLINASKLLVNLSLNVYFVVILEMHILGVLYSSLITSAIFGIILIIYTFKSTGITINTQIARLVILFGAPFIITNVSDFLLTFSDRYFLKAYASLSEVGTYSLGYKLGFILWSFAVMPFWNIWGPQQFEIASKPNAQEINTQVFFIFNLILISVALLISLFSFDLFRIMSSRDFWSAYKIVPIIMLAYIVQAWTDFAKFGILYTGKTKYIAFGTFVSAASILLLSFILIPKLLVYGAALATLISFLVRYLIINHYSQKLFRIPIPWSKILLMLMTAVIINVLSLLFQQDRIIISVLINGSLFVIYLLLLLVLPVFTDIERSVVLNLIRHPIKTIKTGGISNFD